jgi:hypothetical protein
VSNASNAKIAADAATAALANKLSADTRSVLSGGGGIAVGSLNWNSSGNRTSGYGIGITSAGLAAFKSDGSATFVLDGSTGNASFGGTLSAATGTFAGSLSAATGTFSGNLSGASGTFSGTLTAAVINTDNIIGNALTNTYTSSTSGSSVSVYISIPTGATSVIILGNIGSGVYSSVGESSGYSPVNGDLYIDGSLVLNNVAGAIVFSVVNPTSGGHTVQVNRGNYTGQMTLSVIVNKR